MDLFIRLTYKGDIEETTLQLTEDASGKVFLIPAQEGKESIPVWKDKNGNLTLQNISIFDEDEETISDKMLGLSEAYIEAISDGLELTSDGKDEIERQKRVYDPDSIYVENKPFSIRQLMDLIEQGDLDLAPNFQRHFVWDRTRQSLLIESILLGLPLPALYLSQFSDGILTVVDGLQRIHTIRNFVNNKLRLCNLEYLDVCNGKTFEEIKKILPPLRIRKFGQTQLMCFVIDYRSPSELKYDLFRRLNTGGKPLNRQEIRNCLSRPSVQIALLKMSSSKEFKQATDNSVKDKRMQAQEAALRFLYFRSLYSDEYPVGDYNGHMDSSLDKFIDILNDKDNFDNEIACFEEAMKSAFYLFGNQTFRKINSESQRRLGVNKLLMLCISVLLSFYTFTEIATRFEKESLILPLKDLIEKDKEFYRAITYGTNSKWNIETAMIILRDKLLKLNK